MYSSTFENICELFGWELNRVTVHAESVHRFSSRLHDIKTLHRIHVKVIIHGGLWRHCLRHHRLGCIILWILWMLLILLSHYLWHWYLWGCLGSIEIISLVLILLHHWSRGLETRCTLRLHFSKRLHQCIFSWHFRLKWHFRRRCLSIHYRAKRWEVWSFLLSKLVPIKLWPAEACITYLLLLIWPKISSLTGNTGTLLLWWHEYLFAESEGD